MSKNNQGTATASGPRPSPPPAINAPQEAARRESVEPGIVWKVLQPAASLKFTVILLSIGMGLVLFGTLAQVGNGVWTVVDRYFRSFIVIVPLQIFVHPTTKLPAWLCFPYPGGWTIGALLMLNLIAAHATRFKLSWTKIGIWLLHLGMIVMMLGELITGLAAIEYRMIIEEGKSSDHLINYRKLEMAFIDISDPATDRVAAVPGSRLRKGRHVSDPSIPVDIEVVASYTNSKLVKGEPPSSNLATAGVGLRNYVEEIDEVSGVDPDQEDDVPSIYARFTDKTTGKDMGVFLVSMHLKDQIIRVGGKPYQVTLRQEHRYQPYTFHLLKFTHDKYIGTDTPKDYRSRVRIVDAEKHIDRETEIYMNAPLSFDGKTFYQAGFLPPKTGMRGTILQVVRNPGAWLPYISCALVTAGMLFHFGLALFRFTSRTLRSTEVVS